MPVAKTAGINLRKELLPQCIGGGRGVAVVVDAQPATKVDVVDGNTGRLDLLDEIKQAVGSVQVRCHFGDLGADVEIDAHHLEAGEGSGALVGGQSTFMGHAKLVALESGGDIGVGLGVDVRVHADADRRGLAFCDGHFAQNLQLCFAFHVETQNASLQRLPHFQARFTHAGKNHLAGIATGGNDTLQFTTRDDVESTPLAGKKLQQRQRGVGFHGIADMQLASGETTLVSGQCIAHGGHRIDEKRRAVLLGKVAGPQPFDAQVVVTVGDMGSAGQGIGSHGVAVEAGAEGGGAVGSVAPGVNVCGRVARCWAAASVGRNNGPR